MHYLPSWLIENVAVMSRSSSSTGGSSDGTNDSNCDGGGESNGSSNSETGLPIPYGFKLMQTIAKPELIKNQSHSQNQNMNVYMYGHQGLQTRPDETNYLGLHEESDHDNMNPTDYLVHELQERGVSKQILNCHISNDFTAHSSSNPFGGEHQINGQHLGLQVPLQHKQSGFSGVQNMQHQLKLRKMHELQRQKNMQQGDTRQHSLSNQAMSFATHVSGGTSHGFINGNPLFESQGIPGNSLFEHMSGQDPINTEQIQQLNSNHQTKCEKEFQGPQDFIGLSEMTHDKLVTEADTFHGLASLDPDEEKIMYGSDENIWDAFGSDINIDGVIAEASSRVVGLQEELTGVNFLNLNKTPLANVNFSNTLAMGFGIDGAKMKDDHERHMGFVHDDELALNSSSGCPVDPGISIFRIAEALPALTVVDYYASKRRSTSKHYPVWNSRANQEGYTLSAVEVLVIIDETLDAFFQLLIPTHLALLPDLIVGLDQCLQYYTSKAKSGCGSRNTFIPAMLALPRCVAYTKFHSVFRKKEKPANLQRRISQTFQTVYQRSLNSPWCMIRRDSKTMVLLVLLGGGPSHAFTLQDSRQIEDDFKSVRDLFWANGDGFQWMWDVTRVTILAFLGSLEVFLEGSFVVCYGHEDCISFRHQVYYQVVSSEFSSASRMFCYRIMQEFFDECHENEDVHGGQAWFYKGFDQLVIGLAWALPRFAISPWFVVPCSADQVAVPFHHPLLMELHPHVLFLPDKQELDGMVLETTDYTNGDSDHADTHDSRNTPTIDESQGGRVGMLQCVDMHFKQNDGVMCDVEVMSQESRGSGATLGESLRSLDVEIGSVEDDGGERQGPRRINASLGYISDEPRDGVVGSAPIDTAFLDALPEKLRAKVLNEPKSR
uniref:PATROL1-like C-terminal domain-containing protein n=1 Tax=Tanacetum cinerariifolium TaxID=118510 RepID=A0A699H7P8_TANCI|nr:hypothetical protein [Tanacetum cinerariifolium]